MDITEQMARAHVDMWAEQKHRAEVAEARLAVAIEALTEIARLRTDLSGDFSMGSKQSDIARKALAMTLD